MSSGTGYFKYYRNNTPPGEGAFASVSAGNAKPQVDYDLTEVTVTTKYLAGFSRISKEFAQDVPFLTSFVTQELYEDFLRFESNEFAVNIQAAATAAASTGSNYAESIINNIAKLAKSDAVATGIVVDPDGWANILKTKPTDYSVPGGVMIDPDGQIRIAGIPLFMANWDGLAGKAMIGDWSQIWRVETDPLSLASSDSEGTNFTKNQVTYRLECREAVTLRRTEMMLYGAL
jgi:HK97 family phage major capsid protein